MRAESLSVIDVLKLGKAVKQAREERLSLPMRYEQDKTNDEWQSMRLKRLDRERSKLKQMFYAETPRMFMEEMDDEGDMAPKTTKAAHLNFDAFSDMISHRLNVIEEDWDEFKVKQDEAQMNV